MKTAIEDTIADGIYSNSFGAFSPPDAMPLVTTDREIVAMATGVVRGQWEIPPEVFLELPKRLYELAMGQNPRTAAKAAKLLIEMNAANGSPEETDQRGEVVIYIPHNGRDSLPNEIA